MNNAKRSDHFRGMRQFWEGMYTRNPPQALPWEENRPSAELVALVESDIVGKGPALDICSGTGNNAVYLAEHGFTCYGIDISPTAVGLARDKAGSRGTACHLSVGAASQLPYPDSDFNLVFDRGCFHSMPPEIRQRFIRGVHRVLKPNGKYLMLCFSAKDHSSGPPYAFSPQDIRRHFAPLFHILFIKELAAPSHGDKHYFLSVLMEKAPAKTSPD